MTAKEALTWIGESLTLHGIPDAGLEAELFVAAALKTSKEEILAHPERTIPPSRREFLRSALKRRSVREPLAYIVGHKGFYGREFQVNEHVLVPRPETEQLVDEALMRLGQDGRATVADIGTGSGCIAVTLAKERPRVRVIAVDASGQALNVARANAEIHRVRSRITFVHGNLLLPLAGRPVDLIIANLPYVPEDEVRANPDLAFEPLLALRGQHGPDRTLKAFLDQWYAREDRPTAVLEIHPNQAEKLLRENMKIGTHVVIKKDLSGRDRIAVLESKGFAG